MKRNLLIPTALLLGACSIGLAAVFAFAPARSHRASAPLYSNATEARAALERYLAPTLSAESLTLQAAVCVPIRRNGQVIQPTTARSRYFGCLAVISNGSGNACVAATETIVNGEARDVQTGQVAASECTGGTR